MQTRDKKQSKKLMKTIIKIGIELSSLKILKDYDSRNFECNLTATFGCVIFCNKNYDDDSSKFLITVRIYLSKQKKVFPTLKFKFKI